MLFDLIALKGVDVVSGVKRIYLAISENGKAIIQNANNAWTKIDAGVTNYLTKCFAFGNGFYLACGGLGKIHKSLDGLIWTVAATIGSGTGTVLLYNGTLFVVSFGNSYFYTSTDGVTWTGRVSWNTVSSNGGCYGGGKFVIVGNNQIGVSSDGITWTRYTSVTGAIHAVAYGDDLYVIVLSSGQIWTSPDAIIWTQRTSNFTPGFSSTNLYGIAYGNGMWVAGGDGGRRYSSTDGINWTLRSAPTSQAVLSIVYTDGYFWAAGNAGTMTRSADGITWELVDVGAGTLNITGAFVC